MVYCLLLHSPPLYRQRYFYWQREGKTQEGAAQAQRAYYVFGDGTTEACLGKR